MPATPTPPSASTATPTSPPTVTAPAAVDADAPTPSPDIAPPRSTRERILDAASRLILDEGFSGTTVDAVLAAAGASKGAFFHHFPSKDELGCAVVARYAADDVRLLERLMRAAEATSDDPVEQFISFLHAYEAEADLLPLDETGCLFASFVYDRLPEESATRRVMAEAVDAWRALVRAKLEQVVAARPPAIDTDAGSLADQLFVVYEGALVLARITGESTHLRARLAEYRRYVELLFTG